VAKEGFDKRIVSYEYIHSITAEDQKALLNAIDPQPHDKILDAFCGYGAVGKLCLEKEPSIDLWLNDESIVQIKRAEENLVGLSKTHFILGHFPNVDFDGSSFDKVVIKMGVHEVPKVDQSMVAKKVFEILNPHGKFVVWDIMLKKEFQKMWQDIIRKKDALAGFDMLVKERYFFREDEFLDNMKKAGFTKVRDFHTVKYRFSSIKRLREELHNDKRLLDQLNDYIRQRVPEDLKKTLKYEDKGDDIQLSITKKIYVMEKQ
jgi:ubiquinone/menaquinone biosynthesis C-methylase UbiE